MSNVRRFFSLLPAEQRRVAFAFFIVVGVRIGLWVVSFPRFKEFLARFAAPGARYRDAPTTWELAHNVLIASSYVPRATCLTQALAGQILLARYGHPSVVRVGVTKLGSDSKAFEAHAWLESNGQVVIGESERTYVPLATLV